MSSAKVMIVEDEAIVALNLERTVRKMGYGVICVVDTGEDAVEQFELQPADIVLMDVRLKGHMDGIEAARIIASQRSVAIIFLTAYNDEATMNRAQDITSTTFLAKPVDERVLARTMSRAMAISRTMD